MATFTAGAFGNDFDQLDVYSLLLGGASNNSATTFTISTNGQIDNFTGAGFAFGANGYPTAGTVTGISETFNGQLTFSLTGISLSTANLLNYAANSANEL